MNRMEDDEVMSLLFCNYEV